jgi:thiosulfate dehydrogenase [quinone] large subunit
MEPQSRASEGKHGYPRDPALLHELLGNVRLAPLWLPLRVAIGWLWLEVGWGRLGGLVALPGGRGGDLVAVVLTVAGIALMLGALVGPAAFVGGCLSAGLWAGEGLVVAALQFAAVVWLILAWKTAGWIGLDRWLLPALGLPWRGGALVTRLRTSETKRTLGGEAS